MEVEGTFRRSIGTIESSMRAAVVKRGNNNIDARVVCDAIHTIFAHYGTFANWITLKNVCSGRDASN
eukprot:scaffold667_cov103-Skeletonema_dohrnii-CCMP3373.AAC.15